ARPASTNVGARAVKPYAALSGIYDQVVGDSAFPQIRATFQAALRMYRIRFRSAADIGCGTGTFARYLARYGVPVFGVDNSQGMLDIAERKNRYPNLVFLRQDIREFRLPQKVDLITCNHDTLNYMLTESHIRSVFQRCREHLSVDGVYIFDIIIPLQEERPRQRAVLRRSSSTSASDLAAEGFPKKTFVQSSWKSAFDPVKRISTVEIGFLMRRPNGEFERKKEVHVQRWHSLSSIRSLLAQSGLSLLGIHNAENFGPVTNRSPWVKFIAQNRIRG